MFKFLKSMHILKLPLFLLNTTKLEHHVECLVGAMISAANIFSNSFFTIMGQLRIYLPKFLTERFGLLTVRLERDGMLEDILPICF